MRKSVQKETILKIIDESTSHLTSKGVYEIVKETIPRISLGTVYRNLEKLTMENKIIALNTADGIVHYDNKRKVHQHFYCDKCHQISDIFLSIELPNSLNVGNVTSYTLMFHGICKDCLRKD